MNRFGPCGASILGTLTNGQQGAVDQNLSTGQAGTSPPALWANNITEELMSILAAASVTPDANNWSQVLTSLQKLFGGGGSLAGSGWQKLPGGLIIQWMFVSVTAGGTAQSFSLPTTFPTTNFFALATIGSSLALDTYDVGVGLNGNGAVFVTNSNPGTGTAGVYVLALGN